MLKRSQKNKKPDTLDAADAVAQKKPAEPRTSSLAPLMPGLLASAAGILAALALLAFGIHERSEDHAQAMARAQAGSQGSAIRQALGQLTQTAQATARSPSLLRALASGDAGRVDSLERQLSERPGIVDAHINAGGQAALDSNAAGPISFAALDLIQRAERGQTPPAEAYKIDDRWLLYIASPIRSSTQEPVQGALLLVADFDKVLAALAPLPPEAGTLRIVQQFDQAPPQTLLQRGSAGSAERAVTVDGGNPNWRIDFLPAPPALRMTDLVLLALAAVLALAGAWLGLQLVLNAQQRRLREDVRQLGQMMQELYAGKTIQSPTLSLPALDTLAKSLVRLPRRPSPESSTATAAASPEPAARQAKPTDYVDPIFAQTDILDIDILDEDQDLLGLDIMERPAMSSVKAPKLSASIFRAYDIRGVVGESLTPETAYWIGRAVGSESIARGEPNVSVGRDGRLSGPELVQHLIQGLADCGCSVNDIGMVPTPVLYYAANVLAGKSGVMLTGSHNPPNYNGFKIVIAGDTLANEQIQALRQRIESGDLAEGTGTVERVDVLEDYFARIRDDMAIARKLKVVVDCGNGVAGVIAPRLIEAMGCEVIPLFCDVDGRFPNHHPDPGKPENLTDLIACVKRENADLGLAFDGDGDRVGVVTNEGTIVYPDRLLMLFAKDVVSRNPGADIIFDVKCTRRLTPLISGYGGRPVMWKTGHSLIKKKMKESGALLAGEMSGHIFFKERWFGFDDGIYSAARLLETLSQDRRTSEQVFAAFPNDLSTPEINIQVTEESKFELIDALQRDAEWGDANLTTLDGVRVDYPKGWGLVRASNTTPVLVLRFEAETQEELARIQDVFRAQLYTVAPDLKLPF